jgi:hypothetical protein
MTLLSHAETQDGQSPGTDAQPLRTS